MNILSECIISNTDISKDYKKCKDIAKKYGKAFIFKNNVPDMILLDIEIYKKIEILLEEAEHIEIFNMVTDRLGNAKKRYSIEEVEKEILGE